MHSDLVTALREFYGDEPQGSKLRHWKYAMNNRARGQKLVDAITARTGFAFEGTRTLDVGCAYGGFAIQTAALGAESWGVEVNRRLHHYAELNARGEPGRMTFVLGDVLSQEVLSQLPTDFNLALCSDLLEHIRDTGRLLSCLASVLARSGLVVFSVPNGEALSVVMSEPHRGDPGLSLLPPAEWQELNGIFYRPWGYYLGLFHAFGFRRVNVWQSDQSRSVSEITEALDTGFGQFEQAIAGSAVNARSRESILIGLRDLRDRVREDAEREDAATLEWRYLTSTWRGIAVKTAQVAGGVAPREHATSLSGPSLVTFTEPANGYRSKWVHRARVGLSCEGGALRCEVVGSSDTSGGQYGGITFSVRGLGALRLDVTWVNPGNIAAAYIDGYDGRGRRVLRWSGPLSAEAGAETGRRTYSFLPGGDSDGFNAAVEGNVADVARVDVFVRIVPGCEAGFILHKAEVIR